MDKDKHQKHKKQCEKYKAEGRREQNKRIKQQKHEERMAKFAKRREDGKTYTYKKNDNPKDSIEYIEEKLLRADKVIQSDATRFGEGKRLARTFGRLNRDIKKIEDEKREEAIKAKKAKSRKKKKESVSA